MMRMIALAAFSVLWLMPAASQARATFKINESGAGFDDKKPVKPVGGNDGTTVGEQRKLAVAHAIELWGNVLDSSVPIVVDVTFADLGCGQNGVVLGQAGATGFVDGIEAPDADPNLFYPNALANSLAGEDLDPAAPDIQMHINSAPDDVCPSRTHGYYYGFDGKAGDARDLVDIVLHELGHGLGFVSTVDGETGELKFVDDSGKPHLDAFSAQLVDRDSGRPWSQLTAAERAHSAVNPRGLVWAGKEARRVAGQVLSFNQPQVTFDPIVAGWSGIISDTSFGQTPTAAGVTGALVLGQGCEIRRPADPTQPWIALFTRCEPAVAVMAAVEAGAAGTLLDGDGRYETPPSPIEAAVNVTPLTLPLIVLSPEDARNVQLALATRPTMATISADTTQRLGADPEGRPLMFSPNPLSVGSSVSHVDQSLRPNQLMEPTATPREKLDMSLTLAFLQDMGWPSRCGNGSVDPTEECDDGANNNNSEPGRCRSDCRKAYCGDGVHDDGEACDDGMDNSNVHQNACRKNCKHASCGDGVHDDGEACDDGTKNDDKARDACRSDCRAAHCGDGVIDALEQCDDGAKNDDMRADACRKDCRAPRCGDGVVDRGEQCDQGADNGARKIGACRSDCTAPKCGDRILDEGESCDGTSQCNERCQPLMAAAPRSTLRGRDETQQAMGRLKLTDAGAADGGAESPAADSGRSGGCGCRVGPSHQPGGGASAFLLGLASMLRWRRRARRG
ncbi:MAG TPA: hypothetical protein VFN67_25240 [Polyangiales bacterium]|nr:hypothetical protein [Polyangiales bacterium]